MLLLKVLPVALTLARDYVPPPGFLPRSGIAQCSGALIGAQRQHVLTAGHCLVDSSQSTGNVDKITFYPGLKGSDLPFDTLTAVKVGVATRVQAVFQQPFHLRLFEGADPPFGTLTAVEMGTVCASNTWVPPPNAAECAPRTTWCLPFACCNTHACQAPVHWESDNYRYPPWRLGIIWMRRQTAVERRSINNRKLC